ncbi:hypothetical protein [Yoonia sp.]|uniref:hypothetical protein n=1 Tax=Yoonia sp. TaxID=2212373 RepID=UPI0025EB4FCD|nr:hypothetical protein [Yoonia sp.]
MNRSGSFSMVNAAERIFDEILSGLPTSTLELPPEWPDEAADGFEDDDLGLPMEDDGDGLLPLSDELDAERVIERLRGDASPIELPASGCP